MLIGALRRRLRLGEDDGFTLIEVITAIFVISILATSGLYFYMNGMQISSAQERRQLAVTVANEAMEQIRGASLSLTPTSGMAPVVAGRTSASVNAAWSANPTIPGVAQTYPQSDAAATLTSVPVFPVTRTVSRSGTDFAVTTLVGDCYQPALGGDCSKVAGYAVTAPATTPANTTKSIRIIVIVRWTAGNQCTSGCNYTVSALLDNNLDLTWVSP
ncbi:type IV pilus modification PilV family protein [Leifsonia flava]|uniref:Type II secretion system protein n=1 Tax=Orlajensenia leifsoniae TaxID=2561933 RepID=A0A4Y9RAG8_9MICO|nr:type II secretion system protein [Leifsonia flava]TFW00126.1 type II secretion system protein [Leifsonia flava]